MFIVTVIYVSRPFMIQRNAYLGEIKLKVMSGQDFAYAERTDGRHAP